MHKSREYQALEILGPALVDDDEDWAPRLLLAQILVGRSLRSVVDEVIPLTPEGEIEPSKHHSLEALANRALPHCGIKVHIARHLKDYALQVRIDHAAAWLLLSLRRDDE